MLNYKQSKLVLSMQTQALNIIQAWTERPRKVSGYAHRNQCDKYYISFYHLFQLRQKL